ncbi:MAG: hypothetical protein QOJ35_3665, partial [Solirubrobacteraceae bacterium]|nr:hypothetical protein [Solirubrobacteraceae bacterium]
VGKGGMGVVYRAEDLQLGRKVALKLLSPELAENEGFRERFVSESRLAAAIDHPHIIPLYGAMDAEGLLFLIMRYVDGIDLKALLKRDAPLAPERAFTIVGQIADALDAAHARGLVHRDVKPANVLVDVTTSAQASEHCYLTDFGLTKDTSQDIALTATGQFVGTIPYVAPEQIDGAGQGPATDQYALACVLFECLTGHTPYERKTELDVMWAHLNDDPPSITELRPDLPDDLDAVIAKALAKEPEERYETCGAMVAAARAAIAAQTVASQTVVSSTPRPADDGATRVSPRIDQGATAEAEAPPADATRVSAPPAVAAAPTRGRLAVAIAAVAAMVAAGVAGVVVGGGGQKAAPVAANVAATGGLSLRFPTEWETLPAPPEIPGLPFQDRIAIGPRAASGRQALLAGRVTASGTRLLPAKLVAGQDGTDAPHDAVRIGKADAFRFANLHPAGLTGAATIYLLLTDRGRTAIACYAATPSPAFDRSCADVAASLELTGAKALDLAPSPRYATALTRALADAASMRTAGGRRIAAAKTSVAQAAAAGDLAKAYAAAARRLRQLPAPVVARDANGAIATALDDTGAAFSRAATAARTHDRGGYRRAGAAVRRADAALRSAVGALGQLGYQTA